MLERPAVRKVIEREESAKWRERSPRRNIWPNRSRNERSNRDDDLDQRRTRRDRRSGRTENRDAPLRRDAEEAGDGLGRPPWPRPLRPVGLRERRRLVSRQAGRREGRIEAGGIAKDVSFADAGAALHDAIDAAYRAKYGHHGARWVDSMVSSEASSTTIKLVPR
jgi:hypothetical protein